MDFLSFLPLKRDEFYTFLGGFYVSIVWLYSKLQNSDQKLSDLGAKYLILLGVLWIFFTALIFLIGFMLSVFMNYILVKEMNGKLKNDDKIPYTMLNAKECNELYYPFQGYENLQLNMHVCNVLIGTLILCYWPYFMIFDDHLFLLNVGLIFLLVIIFYVDRRMWKTSVAISFLNKNGVLHFFDIRKSSELNTQCYLRNRPPFKKEEGK